MEDITRYLNFLNLKPQIYLNNKSKFNSTLGTFCGFFACLISIILSIFIFNDWSKEENPRVTYTKKLNFSNSENSLKLQNFPLMFKIEEGKFYNNYNEEVNQNSEFSENFIFTLEYFFKENEKNLKEILHY